MAASHPIARVWSGHVPAERAPGFHEHLLATGVAHAQATAGSLGALVLRRAEGQRVRFTLVTLWSDEEAVRRFAGADADAAVLFPGDEAFGLEPDRTVSHHEVVLDRRP